MKNKGLLVVCAIVLIALNGCGTYKKCDKVCDLGVEMPKKASKKEVVECIDKRITCLEGEYNLLKAEKRRLENQNTYLSMDLDNQYFHDSRIALQRADDAAEEMAQIENDLSQLHSFRREIAGKRIK